MLVLSRKKNEPIVFCLRDYVARVLAGEISLDEIEDVRLVVVELRGDKARLGIEAPKSLAVHRQEVLDAIQAKSAEHADA